MVSNADVIRTLERIADLLEAEIPATLVFRSDDGTRFASGTEEDEDATLGLPWIPPQRREDPADVDAVARVPVAMEV
jgi:hypothetical protein